MTKKGYSMVLIALAGSVLIASAQDDTRRGRPERGEGMRERMLRQFDKDGDGRLSESEKTAMKAAMEERKALADTDGDGKVSDAEREAVREKMMKRLDADGDGKVSEAERKAAREQHRQKAE